MPNALGPYHQKRGWAGILLGAGLLLSLGGLVGCAKRPDFTYEQTPGVDLKQLKRVALDPRRDIIWTFEGQRVVAIPEYQQAVFNELLSKGYLLVDPDQADLWVDVIGLVPRPEGSGNRRSMAGSRGRGGGKGRTNSSDTPSPAPVLPNLGGEGMDSAPRPFKALPTYIGGELSVVVELLKKEDQSPVWFGSAYFPAPEKGAAPSLNDTPNGRIKQLMQPL